VKAENNINDIDNTIMNGGKISQVQFRPFRIQAASA
jgi:hypothetical protein